jgi:hypothetical protein
MFDVSTPAVGNGNGCVIPGSPDIIYDTNNGNQALGTGDAKGQSFDSGAGGDVAKVCFYIRDQGADPVVTYRLGVSSDLSTYMEEFGPSDAVSGTVWVCFDSVDNDTLAAATTYYLGVIEVSGAAQVKHQDAGTYGDGLGYGASSGWTMSGSESWDLNFSIYYCE